LGLGKVVKGGLWLYLSNLTNNVLGFFYWLIISAIGGASLLGVTSAVVSLAAMINMSLGLGVAAGLQRFIGYYIGENNTEKIYEYFWTSFYFRLLVYVSAGTAIILLAKSNFMFIGMQPEMLQAVGIIVILSSLNIFMTIPVSFIKIKIIFLSSLVSQITKITVGITLVYLGFGWRGAVLGAISYTLVYTTFLSLQSLKIIKLRKIFNINALKDVMIAGLSSWLPATIATIAQRSGIISVFGTSGASETGYYYVATQISNVVIMLGSSILSLLLPFLSSIKDGRKRANWQALRISLAVMTPVLFFLVYYPWLPLSLLGKEYVSASPILVILLLGGLPLAITLAVNNLVFSYGCYRYVLAIGLFQNIPRVVLYSLLVPLYHGTGAAISVTIGSLMGLIASSIIAYKISYRIRWKEIVCILAPPLLFGAICRLLNISWMLGIIFIIILSALVYAKLGIITKKDLRELSISIIPQEKLQKIIPYIKPVIDVLYET